MIEKLKKAEVPERFLGKISVPAKRIITDNQNIILDFLENQIIHNNPRRISQ